MPEPLIAEVRLPDEYWIAVVPKIAPPFFKGPYQDPGEAARVADTEQRDGGNAVVIGRR